VRISLLRQLGGRARRRDRRLRHRLASGQGLAAALGVWSDERRRLGATSHGVSGWASACGKSWKSCSVLHLRGGRQRFRAGAEHSQGWRHSTHQLTPASMYTLRGRHGCTGAADSHALPADCGSEVIRTAALAYADLRVMAIELTNSYLNCHLAAASLIALYSCAST
jgi:hypothetical protein